MVGRERWKGSVATLDSLTAIAGERIDTAASSIGTANKVKQPRVGALGLDDASNLLLESVSPTVMLNANTAARLVNG